MYWRYKKLCKLAYFIIDDVPLFRIKTNNINFGIQAYSLSTTTYLL